MNALRPAGSAHGRFQPFHKGHLEYLLAAKAHVSYLWVGITLYEGPIVHARRGRKREEPEHNPLTYFERMLVIADALVDAGVSKSSFGFVPFPIETPALLPNFLPRSVPCFTTVYDKWNREKVLLLKDAGYQVEVLWERSSKEFEGGRVRDSIVNGDDRWREWVPPATSRFIDAHEIRERLIASRRKAEGSPDAGSPE